MELTREQHVKLYTNLLRVRKLDELLVQAYYSRKTVGPLLPQPAGSRSDRRGSVHVPERGRLPLVHASRPRRV